jgi:hypothetical protein
LQGSAGRLVESGKPVAEDSVGREPGGQWVAKRAAAGQLVWRERVGGL